MTTPDTTHPANCGVCTGYEVPAEYVELADSHYSHHGSGLTYNLLAAVPPVALAEVTAERDQFRDAALMYSAMVGDRNVERDRLQEALNEMTRCRDNAVRAAEHADQSIDVDLEGLVADGVAYLGIEWSDGPGDSWLSEEVVAMVRPVVAHAVKRAKNAEAERDRLLVALRSAHCALYEGNAPKMALDIIDEALKGQQDGED